MAFAVTDQWLIDTMVKNDWCLNSDVFVYPDGLQKDELKIPAGEKVCASISDALYLSIKAVYVRNKTGTYTRLLWAEMDEVAWLLRTVNGYPVSAIRYATIDGRKSVAVMPFSAIPRYFYEVHNTCFAELSPGGKKCKLPGPVRFATYARVAAEAAPWTEKIRRDKTVWFRELACRCNAEKGFSLHYLGQLMENGCITDGELRQRLVATCKACGESLEVFDSFRNGYNAVICGEHKKEPPGREAKTVYKCCCDRNRFSLGVAVVYDADDLNGFRKDKRSEAYGWFSAYATCKSCHKVTHVVDYETA